MRIISLILLLFVLALPIPASAFDVGDRVILQPTNPLGVPLHRESRSSMFGRGSEGDAGVVQETANEGRWLKVELEDGIEAWILEKYLTAQSGGTGAPTPAETDAAAVFGSLEQCEQVVAQGGRMAPKSDGTLRLATWNIRWFPEGDPRHAGKETDLAWLACTLAWIDPDAVALQEILDTREADFAWASVTDGIEGFIGGDWEIDLHECGGSSFQHVGFLWNAEQVALADAEDHWELNGAAVGPSEPCANNLRPGRGAYVRGLPSGADFHIVSVHSDSGTDSRDFDHRQNALQRLDELFTSLQADQSDGDVIVLGDLNTMGADDRMSASDEIALMRQTALSESPGYRALAPDLPCTEYFKGSCGVLDHIIVSEPMAEADEAQALVSGYCAVEMAQPLDPDAMPDAYERLSDHCPVIVEIENADRD